MDFQLHIPTPLDYFATLVQSDEAFPLLEAAASLAQDEDPHLDTQQVLAEVDQLAAKLLRRVSPQADDMDKLQVLNAFFFDEMGFAGNVNHYDDPGNSYLNVVLKTRRGIPISLAVLWLELAAGLGLKACGVGFPGHFLVKVSLAAMADAHVVLDPFSGQSLSREDLSERLAPWLPGVALGRPDAVSDEALLHYLQAATPRSMVERMLNNLREIFRREGDAQRQGQVERRLAIVQR